jgi:23S rRNA pseudouridine955/2504/2580 synthase/23S rRNA pseudouridine1911/1915/1917 synthase
MEHPGKNGKMITHVKGKPALTDYKVVERFKKYAWLSLQIHTGKTHQIRVHMQHIGSPIACDPLYGNNEPILLSSLKKKFKLSKAEDEERPIMGRLALHAHTLTFTLGAETFNFEAPIPKDLRALLQQLRKWDA